MKYEIMMFDEPCDGRGFGGKARRYAEMAAAGIPIAPGFAGSCDDLSQILPDGKSLDPELRKRMTEALVRLEEKTGKRLGDGKNPLLLSFCASSDTDDSNSVLRIRNLGMNETVAGGLAERSGNPVWAWNSYCNLIRSYANTVLGIPMTAFQEIAEELRRERNLSRESMLEAAELQVLAERFRNFVRKQCAEGFPEDPAEQILQVLTSAYQARANGAGSPASGNRKCTVVIRAEVFGNVGSDCCVGIVFTRNPETGDRELFGEFLPNATGRELIAGARTPMHLKDLSQWFPELVQPLEAACRKLEARAHDMQDIEFVVEHRRLYILASQNGRRRMAAAEKIAADLMSEGLIGAEEAESMRRDRKLIVELGDQA